MLASQDWYSCTLPRGPKLIKCHVKHIRRSVLCYHHHQHTKSSRISRPSETANENGAGDTFCHLIGERHTITVSHLRVLGAVYTTTRGCLDHRVYKINNLLCKQRNLLHLYVFRKSEREIEKVREWERPA